MRRWMRWRMRRSHHSISWSSFVAGCFEGSAHEEALHLHGEEGLEDGGGIEVKAGGEGVGGGGAEDL